MIRRAGTNPSSRSQRTYYEPIRKFREKNIVSAVLGTTTIVVLCASLVEPVWFTLEGGKCCHKFIGINAFFGKINTASLPDLYGESDCSPDQAEGKDKNSYKNCINTTALTLIQVIILICFSAISSSLFSFILDITAPRKRPLWKIMKRYAFGYILTVLLCATATGFCYWTSQEIYDLQFSNRLHEGSTVKVSFASGVYLVASAGGVAVLATASNLMRQYPTEEEEQAERLIEEEAEDDADIACANVAGSASVPPPYAP